MSVYSRRLLLVLHGQLDQSRLDELRKLLGMKPSGESTDPVGSELGRRVQHDRQFPSVESVVLTLWRTDSHAWTLTVDARPSTDIGPWQSLAEIGSRAAGLTIVHRLLRPEDTPSSDLSESVARLLADVARHADSTEIDPALDWHALSEAQIVELADRMRRFVWSWQLDDLPAPAAVFAWPLRRVEVDRLVLDTKLGTADGYVYGSMNRAEYLAVPVTTPVSDHSVLHEVFGRMSTALIDALGDPSAAAPRHRTWRGSQTTLILAQLPPSMHLLLTPSAQLIGPRMPGPPPLTPNGRVSQ